MYDPDDPFREPKPDPSKAFGLRLAGSAIDPAPAPEPAETYEAANSVDDLIQGLHPGAVPRHDADWQAQYEARIDTAREQLWKED
jgi:hypothetical protein